MPGQNLYAVRSMTKMIRESVSKYVEVTGKAPAELHLDQTIYDVLRAELLATGRLKPGELLRTFEGLKVTVWKNGTLLELK